MPFTSIVQWAASYNNEEVIRECIKIGFDINQENFLFKTPLMLAVHENNINLVKILVENNANINTVNIFGTTALQYAQLNSHIKNYLISKGAKNDTINNNSEEKSELSPYMWLIWDEHFDNFKHYLKQGADVNEVGRNGLTPLMIACLNKNFNFIKILVENGANINQLDNYGNSALIYVLSNIYYAPYSEKVVDYLIEKGAKIDFCGPYGNTPLIQSVLKGDIQAINHVLTKNINVNFYNSHGNTALAYAAIVGDIKLAEILLDKGADINLCGPNGRTPLTWSVISHQFHMIHFLMEKGADLHFVDCDGNTVLYYANIYFEKVARYFELKGLVHEKPKMIITIKKENTIFSAIEENDLEAVKKCITNGIDPCKKNTSGKTPLICAIQKKNFEIVMYLLDNGAELTIHSALPVAIEENDEEFVKLLIEKKADINKIYRRFNQTPILQAVNQNNRKIVEILLDFGANPNTGENPSPIRKAVQLENFDIVKMLLEKGGNIGEVTEDGGSLLKEAVCTKNLRLVIYLIEKGVNLDKDMEILKEFAGENDDFDIFFEKFVSQKNKENYSK